MTKGKGLFVAMDGLPNESILLRSQEPLANPRTPRATITGPVKSVTPTFGFDGGVDICFDSFFAQLQIATLHYYQQMALVVASKVQLPSQ